MKIPIDCYIIAKNIQLSEKKDIVKHIKGLDEEWKYIFHHRLEEPKKYPCIISFSILNTSVFPHECYHIYEYNN